MIYDVIIIGAGPAGLAAGLLLEKEKVQYVILEKGKDLLRRNVRNPEDVASGIGGSGLFSDGKLSFPPSASEMWGKLDGRELKAAYLFLKQTLDGLGIIIPDWEEQWRKTEPIEGEKEYCSIVFNDFLRNRILNSFYDKNRPYTFSDSEVVAISDMQTYYEVTVKNGKLYQGRNLIIASGKYGNRILSHFKIQKQINKIELGIRLEIPSEYFKPCEKSLEDFKVIKRITDGVQFRTFCSCKQGIVLPSKFDKYYSHNGSRTQFSTGKSNIGMVMRTDGTPSIYKSELGNRLSNIVEPFKRELSDFVYGNEILIGEHTDCVLKNQIHILCDMEKSILEKCCIYGPEIEYVGSYADVINNNLMLSKNVWVAGDVSGSFRGLMAAMLSGIYCGNSICYEIEKNVRNNIAYLGIKESDSASMDMIFTAQSKNYFYCRDTICEYVLRQGKLPVNPFRVFDYFLGDRVDRELIRRGNNQLLKACKELWVFGPIADGVLFEIAQAIRQKKQIRFFRLGTRVEEIGEIKIDDISFEPEVHARQVKKTDLIAFVQNQYIENRQINLFDFLAKGTEDES